MSHFSFSTSPSVAVVIPTLNRPDNLRRCLESIQAQTLKPQRCVVLDQSDDDRTKLLFEFLRWDGVEKVYGYNSVKSLILARNKGLDLAGEVDLICYLDDDLRLHPEFLERLVARFASDKDGLYAGGMGSVSGAKYKRKRFYQIFGMMQDGDGRFLAHGIPTFAHWKTEFSDVEFLSGGITMYRRHILQQNRFDERMVGYGYGDDVDVSYRVSRKWKNFVEPKALADHDDHAGGRDPGFIHRKNWVQNFFYLLQKNVPWSFESRMRFIWMLLGIFVDDVWHLRKGAVAGNIVAWARILTGRIDSVEGYPERGVL